MHRSRFIAAIALVVALGAAGVVALRVLGWILAGALTAALARLYFARDQLP